MSASANVSQFLKGLAQANARKRAAARRALRRFGEHVIGDAQQLTPVKTGALQGSGLVAPNDGDEQRRISVTLGFNTHYAAAVHERLEAKHAKGQAKFLETSVRNNTPKMAPFIAKEMRE